MTLSSKRLTPKAGEAEIHLGKLQLQSKGCLSILKPPFPILVLLIQKDKTSLCFSMKAPTHVFHMIITLGMVNFPPKS